MIGRNNPLNIRYSVLNKWKGQSGYIRGFCNFREIRFCIRAAYKIFLAYRSRGIVTYEQIIMAFAPYVENPTASYIRYVCEKCCVDSWDKPSSTEDFATLIYYMWCFEQGSQRPPILTIAQIEDIISDYDFITG